MTPTTRTIRTAGGLYEATVPIHRPESVAGLASVFADAHRRRKRVTLIGAGESFGRQALPPEGAEGVDTSALGGAVRRLESNDDGVWVRAPGSRTFEQLWRDVPGHLPRHPPTGDRITLAGALAACTYNTSGYFADDVRAFSLMAPDGTVHECRADASGIAGALYRAVPGSLGALGVILEVELWLRRFDPDHRVHIRVLYRGPAADVGALDALDAAHDRGKHDLGLGVYFYCYAGGGGATVLLGDRLVRARPGRRPPALPLTDEALRRNVALQGLANLAPSVAHRLQPLVLRPGREFEARVYGFTYFQRSYERAREELAAQSWWARCLRRVGVEPHLPVYHQSFVIPRRHGRAFLELYFDALRSDERVVRRLEIQDLVQLPECPWPMHSGHGMKGGFYLLTVSFSVRGGAAGSPPVLRFLERVGREAFARFGVRLLLHKQAHADADTMVSMYSGFVAHLDPLRRAVDPGRVLTSQLLEQVSAT